MRRLDCCLRTRKKRRKIPLRYNKQFVKSKKSASQNGPIQAFRLVLVHCFSSTTNAHVYFMETPWLNLLFVLYPLPLALSSILKKIIQNRADFFFCPAYPSVKFHWGLQFGNTCGT